MKKASNNRGLFCLGHHKFAGTVGAYGLQLAADLAFRAPCAASSHTRDSFRRLISMRVPAPRFTVALLLSACLSTAASFAADSPPVAPVRPVTDTYYGTAVVDPYRYFENLKDPEVQSWMKAQAAYSRSVLDRVPGRDALLDRIHALSNVDTRRGGFVQRGQRYFYQVTEPGAQQPKLFYRDGLAGVEHLLLDPATLSAGTATHYAVDYYTPSWDGKLLAYGLSTGGSEASVLRVLDLASGKDLAESIERAHGSIITWRADNRSFFYFKFSPVTADTPPQRPSTTRGLICT